jgi:gliding motility-associated-like protein
MELGPNNNIEQLFKSGFEDFSPEVDPKVWNNIQHSISSGNASSSFLGSLAGKLILGSAAVVAITVTTVLLLNNNTPETKTTHPETKTTAQNNIVTSDHSNTTTPTNTVPSTDNVVKNNDTPITNTNTSGNEQKVNTNEPDPNHVPNNVNNVPAPKTHVTHNNPDPNKIKQEPKQEPKQPVNPNPMVNNHQEPVNNNNTEPEHNTSAHLNKQPLAKIDFTPSQMGGLYGPIAISFRNMAKAATHEWNFGDHSSGVNNTSNQQNPSHIYEYPGEYTIILSATNEQGRTEKDSVKIRILNNAFFIPNTFTPNGDGNNDVYKVIKNDNYPFEISNLEIVIFDRTNNKVAAFNSTDYGWDGISISNGKKCPQGTYLVLVRYTSSEDGASREQKGSLFLKE